MSQNTWSEHIDKEEFLFLTAFKQKKEKQANKGLAL